MYLENLARFSPLLGCYFLFLCHVYALVSHTHQVFGFLLLSFSDEVDSAEVLVVHGCKLASKLLSLFLYSSLRISLKRQLEFFHELLALPVLLLSHF